MNSNLVILANVGGVAVIVGGIIVLVWMDHRAKQRWRELEHTERMKALELGRPLEDAAVARSKALGAIGVVVPIVSLSGALVGSCFALAFDDPLWRFAAFAVNWVACGAVCAAVVPLVLTRLREKSSPLESSDDADPESR